MRQTVRIAPLRRAGEVVGTITFIAEATERASDAPEELQRLQAELQELQNRYSTLRAIVDNLPDFVYAKDPEGRFLIVNRAMAELVGARAPDDLQGKTDFDLFPPEMAARYAADERAVLASGRPLIGREEPVWRADGTTIWVSTTKAPLFNGHGMVRGLVGISRDITRRREAELALRASEEFLRAIFEHSAIGIGIVDLQGRTLESNAALQAMLGYPAEELRGRHFAAVTHEDDRAGDERLFADLAAGQIDHYRLHKRYRRRDGATIWANVTVSLIRDAAGAPRLAVGMAEDVTHLHEAEEALRAEKRRLESLYAISRELAQTLDLPEVADRALQQIADMLGGGAGEIFTLDPQGQRLHLLAASATDAAQMADLNARLDLPLGQWLAGWTALARETTVIGDAEADPRWHDLPDGHDWGRSVVSIPLIAGNELLGVLHWHHHEADHFSAEEISLLRAAAAPLAVALQNARLYQSVQQMNRQLQQALQARDEMIQNVSHELRTPLTLIMGYAELLSDHTLGQLSEGQAHALNVITQAGQRLQYMINRLLTLQTVGAEHLLRIPLNLVDLIQEAIRTWQARAAAEGITVHLIHPPTLPLIHGDPGLLFQVFENLIDNAIKFSDGGSEIEIAVAAAEGEVRVSVRDRGIGIPADKLEEIFHLFRQVDGSSTRRYGGMGIGLALCREIVRVHGGRIWAESASVGRGSTFYVALPAQ
jgi:PAS domain S-box-containing protein